MHNFAQNLRALRMRCALTQAQLAARTGVSQSTVAAWESGMRRPPLSRMQALGGALGVPAGQLFSDAPDVRDETLAVACGASMGPDGRLRLRLQKTRMPLPAQFADPARPQDYILFCIGDDAMYPLLMQGDTLLLQRTDDFCDGDVVLAGFGRRVALRRIRREKDGTCTLSCVNAQYAPRTLPMTKVRVFAQAIALFRTRF